MSNTSLVRKRRTFLTRQQLAERWSVCDRTVDRMARTIDEFPKPVRISGRRLLWPEDVILAFEDTRKDA
jgi:predicted DNA-binding transcriptional regulator AlpA